MKNQIVFILVFLSIGLFSCTNNSSKKTSDSLDDVSVEETKEILSSIPAPNSMEIMEALNKAGAAYIYDITNDPSFVDNYMTLKQQSLALGIYCTDLSYLVTYNQQDILPDYIKSVFKLTESLEISAIKKERVQSNINNPDSLEFLVEDLLKKSNEYLNTNQKVDVALYILAASWIETVYLTEKIIEFSGNQTPLMKVIIDNRKQFYTVVDLFEKRKDKEGFANIYDYLKGMKDLFEKLVVNSGDEQTIEELQSYIKNVRNEII